MTGEAQPTTGPGTVTRTADRVSDDIGAFVDAQLQKGREVSGTGGTADRRRLFRLMREEGLSAYPLFAVLALNVTNSLAASATGLVAPDIARTFGLTPVFFTILALASQVLSFAVPLAVARFVQNRARRALVVLVTQGVWCLLTGVHGIITTVVALMVLSILDSVTTSAQQTVSDPLLIDLYPPSIRVRVVGFLAATGIVTGLVATATTALLTGPLGLSWRGVYLTVGALSLAGFLFALRLRDPGYGRYDTELVRRQARDVLAASRAVGSAADPAVSAPPAHPDQAKDAGAGTRLTMLEALRRIWAISSMRILLVSTMIIGLQLPMSVYLQFYFANRFSLDASERALLALVGGVAALASYIVLAPIGDRIFQRSPQRLFYIAGAIELAGTLLGLGQLFVFTIPALVVFAVLGAAFTGLSGPAVTVGTMSIVPAPLRPHVSAVTAMFALLGGAIGTALLGGLTVSLGIPTAIALTTVIGMAATVMSMVAGRYVRHDLDAVIEEVVEDEFVSHLSTGNGRLPVLSVRKLDFGYGQTQVLFGVDLAVQEGELIALLGVNGAGKSTLLRAISGLGISSSGSIRLRGHDITFLDADRRTRLGITQVPGGRAIFRDLSVLDHLRCYGLGLPSGERKQLGARIDEVFATFPQLERQRHLPAVSLSGGEQQMLGLAKALVLRPQLLLIDELSLGLAPKVVGELLEVVTSINDSGTAVVLVEQSVNVALTVARRAYFMERGQVRFDGPTEELRDSDLLRAVFLGGAGAVQR